MEKEAFLIHALTKLRDIETFNKVIYEWNSNNISFKDALFCTLKKDETYTAILDKEPQKLLKYFKNTITETLLYDLLVNSVEICKKNFIDDKDDKITQYLNKCNFEEKVKESLSWFSKTLRNNLVHHQDASVEVKTKNDKYIFTLPKNREKDSANQTISLTETEFIRLIYFTTLFWQRENKNSIGSFEDDVMYLEGEDLSKTTNTEADFYIDSLWLKAHDFLDKVSENFDKNNLLPSCVQLTSALCFDKSTTALRIITQLFENPDLKYSAIKSNKDNDSPLYMLQNDLERIGTKDIISLDTITKSIMGSLDEEFFKGKEFSQIADIDMENIKSIRNAFIHNRYIHSTEQNSFTLLKKENYKSQKLELLGEISSDDLKFLLNEICYTQFKRQNVKTYVKEKFNLQP